jgi:hypothetical protein
MVFGSTTLPDTVSPAEARRSLDSAWSYFITHDGVEDGNVSQGYCRADPRILDNYSGPASCLWSLRSLIPAYYLPVTAPLWNTGGGKLPIELDNYAVRISTTGWTIIGDTGTGDITLTTSGTIDAGARLDDYSLLRRVATSVLWRPFRPDNTKAKYHLRSYSSTTPFCGCNAGADK